MTTYSTQLGFTLPAHGDNVDTWDVPVNLNTGTLIEQAIAGYVTQAITDGADTTITIPDGATGVARNMFLELTGALTADRNLIVPAKTKLYFIFNNTTGSHNVTVKVTGLTGVTVPPLMKALLVCNGTDIVQAHTWISSPTFVTPALGTPASGVATNLTGTATGLTAGISNALKSATTTVDVSAATAPTTGNVLTATDSTHATWQTPATPASFDVLSFIENSDSFGGF